MGTCTGFRLLHESIHHTRLEPDVVSREMLEVCLCLAQGLIEQLKTEKVLCVTDGAKATHYRKFQLLHEAQHPPTKKTVLNLSMVPLEESALSALGNGLNFVVAPVFVPVEDILCGVKKTIGALQEEVQQETVRILMC
jgi:hypothetical protein